MLTDRIAGLARRAPWLIAATLALSTLSTPLLFAHDSGAALASRSDDDDDDDKAARFEFKNFCVASLSGSTLTISSGSLSVAINVAGSHGNLGPRLGSPIGGGTGTVTTPTAGSTATVTSPTAGSTATATATVPADPASLVGRQVRVKGSVVNGAYVAHEVDVKNKDCASASATPSATTTATVTSTSTSTSASMGDDRREDRREDRRDDRREDRRQDNDDDEDDDNGGGRGNNGRGGRGERDDD